ncbi:MAG: peptidase MA family metallohydrolase [Dehalococcoidia bacterium]|nr:peptidase MA family metallohydrolase [Dehalococcoidia bacterium]
MRRHNIAQRIFGLGVAVMLIVGLALGAGPSLAQGEPEITRMAAVPNFPGAITFTLEASAGAAIIDIRLHYRVERDSYAKVVSEAKPVFAPAAQVVVSWTWDLRYIGGLPPGAAVEYWWTVRDVSGLSVTSTPETFIFTDTRFQWQQTVWDNLTVYWYSGGESGAQVLLEASLAGLAELEAKTGARLTRPVQIYVYASTEAMLGAMMFAQEWTGAATYTDHATILIGLSSDWEWNERTMVHELAHMISYQLTRGPYTRLPIWLSEGFSMYAEGELSLFPASELTSALNDGTTLTVHSLSGPFSADPARSYLSYAQSYSLVDYLAATYGQERLLALLAVFAGGADYDGALQEVYDFDMDGLYDRWLRYAMIKYVGMILA